MRRINARISNSCLWILLLRLSLQFCIKDSSRRADQASTNRWRLHMTAVLTTVLNLFVALVGPNGSAIYVAPSQIVAVIGSPGVGACPTTLITMSQPVYVCESPAEVKRKFEESSSQVQRKLEAVE